jgi:chromosome segregation ATPase
MKLLRLATGKSEPPPRSPERIALAAAIDRHAAALADFAATEKALSETRARIYHADGAREAIEKARAAIEEAKTNAADHLTSLALGTAGDAPISVEDARAALRAAEDKLVALEATETALAARLKSCESALYFKRDHLNKGLQDVVKSETGVRKLLSEFAALKREINERSDVLRWLHSKSLIPDEFKGWGNEKIYNDLRDGTAPWKDAFDRLSIDADAPLPTS